MWQTHDDASRVTKTAWQTGRSATTINAAHIEHDAREII
jgi:hypothetical protein